MRLFVKSYNPEQDYFVCTDKDGWEHRVDLLVDGRPAGMPDDVTDVRKYLVGKYVVAETLSPYIEIGNTVTVETPG